MSTPAIEALGWALVHFLWQGALVALALEALLFALRERSARLRYALRCAALGVMGLLPVATFLWLTRDAAAPPLFPEQLEAYLAAAQAAGAAAGPGPMGWCVAAWALGASLCAARVLRDYARVRRLQSRAAGRPLPPDWQARFERLARRMNARAVVRVIDSAALAGPTVIGWLKPVVLVPARALTGLTTEQLEVVLVHELAHVRRHDYLVNLVQSALEALLFYQPAVWWVSHGIRAEREFCCDDAALSLASDGVVYARALATLESWRNTQPELALSTLGGPLMTRIQRLIGIRPSSRPVRGPLAALGALLVIGSTTAFANRPPEGQDPAQLKRMREHLVEMQQRLDELSAMLDQAAEGELGGDVEVEVEVQQDFEPGGEGSEAAGSRFRWALPRREGAEREVVVLRGLDGDDDTVVLRIEGLGGDRESLSAQVKALIEQRHQEGRGHLGKLLEEHVGQLGELHAERGEHGEYAQKLHEHLRTLLHGEEDGGQLGRLHAERGEQREHVQKLHEHLRTLFHGEEDSEGEVEGEAEIEVIIRRGNEPEQRIHKRIPLGRGLFGLRPLGERDGKFELFLDREGSDDLELRELDAEDATLFGRGPARFKLRLGDDEGGAGYGDQKFRVLELKKSDEQGRVLKLGKLPLKGKVLLESKLPLKLDLRGTGGEGCDDQAPPCETEAGTGTAKREIV